MHWTDEHFIKLAKQGFKYGFLARGSKNNEFKGANNLNEIAAMAKLNCFDDCTIFYGLSPEESLDEMPPHHLYMAYIFPPEGSAKKPEWYVMGYVVELWRYADK